MNKINKIYCFDLDNVICKTKKNFYKTSKPNKEVIKIINALHKKGDKILIYTARGMTKYNENKKLIEKYLRPITETQLKKWGVQYDELKMCKPSYDIYIDDKNFGFNKNWYKNFKV